MPNDDGREVKIDTQVVFRGFDGVWRHFIRVCNLTTTVRDVWVTTWPYDGNLGKIGQKTGQRIPSLAPGTCVFISIPIGGEPTQFYTDVYDYSNLWPSHEGGRYHYVIDSARVIDLFPIYRDFLRPRGIRIFTVGFALPYPRSLEPGGGRRQFYVRGVRGLPPGWKVRNLWPAKGETFALTPDQKEFPGRLELVCGKQMPPRGVTTITVEAGIRGKPFRPPWILQIRIPFARIDRAPTIAELAVRRQAERGCLHVATRITHRAGLIEAPEFIFSLDDGRSWKTSVLAVKEIHQMDAIGAVDVSFEGTVTLPAADAPVWAKIRAPDRLGNAAESPMTRYRGEKSRRRRPSPPKG